MHKGYIQIILFVIENNGIVIPREMLSLQHHIM
jgi:hypothetical protein